MSFLHGHKVVTNRQVSFSGTGELAESVACSSTNYLRIVVKNVGASNEVVVKGWLKGQSTGERTTIGTLTGSTSNSGTLVSVDRWDYFILECTTYDPSGNAEVIYSGFWNSKETTNSGSGGGGVPSLSTEIVITNKTVTDTAAALLASPQTDNVSFAVINDGDFSIFLGSSASVTTNGANKGVELKAGWTVSIDADSDLFYAICETGKTVATQILEGK